MPEINYVLSHTCMTFAVCPVHPAHARPPSLLSCALPSRMPPKDQNSLILLLLLLETHVVFLGGIKEQLPSIPVK